MLRALGLGSTKRTQTFLQNLLDGNFMAGLEPLAQRGVDALASATPQDSGKTATSWTYQIKQSRGGLTTIAWENTNVNNGANIAILLQYGHGTGTGGYVAGYDYINPAIRPIFDQIATSVWEKVARA